MPPPATIHPGSFYQLALHPKQLPEVMAAKLTLFVGPTLWSDQSVVLQLDLLVEVVDSLVLHAFAPSNVFPV